MHPAYRFLMDEVHKPEHQRYADNGQLNLRQLFVSRGYYDALKEYFKEYSPTSYDYYMEYIHVVNNNQNWEIVNVEFIPPIGPPPVIEEIADVDFG